MKSREEFEASILRKRDIAIKKQKKITKITISSLAIVICLGTSAFAMHGITNQPDISGDDILYEPTATAAQTAAASEITEDGSQAVTLPSEESSCETRTEAETEKMQSETSTKKEAPDIAVPTEAATAVSTTVRPESEESGTSDETKNDGNIFEGLIGNLGGSLGPSAFGDPEYPADSGEDDFPDEKAVIETAYGYLTDEEKDKVNIGKTAVTVTRNEDTSEYYTVYFLVEKKTVIIEIDADTYELIEKRETASDGSQVSLPFVPTTQAAE